MNKVDTLSNFNVDLNKAKESKKPRSSNIELLRFILAIFVVTIHFRSSSFWYFPFLFGSVNCFAIISGYFLVKSNDNLRFLKFIPTIIILYVVNISLYLFFNFVTSYHFFTKKEDWLRLIEFGPGTWWYIWGILIVYILSPFLNYGLQRLGKRNAAILIIALWLSFQIQGALKYSYSPFGYSFGSIIILIYAYLLGGYLKLYGQNFLNNKKIIYISALIFFCVQYLFQVLYFGVFSEKITWLNFSGDNNSLFALPTGFFLFAIFINMPIKNSRFINFLGELSLPIFAFQIGCLSFSNVLMNAWSIEFTYWNHTLISVALLILISLLFYYPYKKYNYFIRYLINKSIEKRKKKEITINSI